MALENLSKNKNLTITPFDKGGGVVIRDSDNYPEKLESLLTDDNTYEKTNERPVNTNTQEFKKPIKSVLKMKTNQQRLPQTSKSNQKAPIPFLVTIDPLW